MPRIEVPMPQMGESIAEGTVSVWLKKIGDRVERDEPIMEISTDKVDAEIPSPAAGILTEILVAEGTTVEVGTVVAYVDTDAVEGAVSPPPEPPSSQPAVAEAAIQRGVAVASAPPSSSAGAFAGDRAATDTSHPESEGERLRRRSSPLVRRIAAEHSVDLRDVSGTGRAGRVTKRDILAHIEGGGAAGAGTGAVADPSLWGRFYSEVRHPEVQARDGDRSERLSRMTSLIAEHMVLSKRISPHVHSYFEIDYSAIDRIRRAHASTWSEQGVKVTYTAFIARAVAQALREHPKLNASISGENVIYRGKVNLGVAVALDWGLIVPVVPDADNLSLVGVARAIADLAERARAKRLSPEEVQGGTFTITNPGVFGTVLGFPILNQPQVAIMAVGAVEKRPVVVADEFGNDAIVARKRGFISLGYDHRLVNGADADRFLARVKELLETFSESA